MRNLFLVAALALAATACGGNGASKPDAAPHPDAAPLHDAAPDTPPDAVPDAAVTDGIPQAKAAADGTGLSLPITSVVVTYLKPQIGSMTNDPAGFTIQATKTGPGLFVSVDPTTLTPVPAVGDVVSFTITAMGTVGMQRRAQAISGFSRASTGTDVSTLATDVTAAADLVSAIDTYDSRLVSVTGTTFEAPTTSGTGFLKAGLTTTGVAADPNLQLRAPITLVDGIDIAMSCTIALHNVPAGRFNLQAQLPAFVAGDITLTACPAPTVSAAVALSPTQVRFTFSRNIKPATVLTDGSQFTFDNGLTASAAVVAGKTITVTTSMQTSGVTYGATIANALTDLQNTALVNGTASFGGFVVAAKVRINEVNANITTGCDLIELRVIEGGSMAGFKITERLGGSGELNLTFPANFIVAKNDFVLVHTVGTTAATCNPGNATSETTSPAGQPALTFPNNVDTAYDFWSTDTGLTSTDNVFTLNDAQGAIIDALFASDDPAGATAAAATESAAALVGAASQWDPVLATYIDTVFRTNAADDLNATGITQAGNSMQRVNDADTNNKADWTTGGGVASTWGALNPGQAALP